MRFLTLTRAAAPRAHWALVGYLCHLVQGGKRGFGNGGPASNCTRGRKVLVFSVLECTRKTICHVPWALRWAVLITSLYCWVLIKLQASPAGFKSNYKPSWRDSNQSKRRAIPPFSGSFAALCHLVCWGLWSSALSALCCWVQWQAAAGAEFELTGAAAVCRRLFAVPK